jgi:hypothetical protein
MKESVEMGRGSKKGKRGLKGKGGAVNTQEYTEQLLTRRVNIKEEHWDING